MLTTNMHVLVFFMHYVSGRHVQDTQYVKSIINFHILHFMIKFDFALCSYRVCICQWEKLRWTYLVVPKLIRVISVPEKKIKKKTKNWMILYIIKQIIKMINFCPQKRFIVIVFETYYRKSLLICILLRLHSRTITVSQLLPTT